MPRPLDGAVGERLELPEYYTDFERHFAEAREFLKLERGQAFAEPGNPSWEAFSHGDWARSMALIECLREDLKEYHRQAEAAGTSTYRIRIVSFPLTPYVQWELHVLRLRDETGGSVRILLDSAVADVEDQGPLPDIYTVDRAVMYEAVYDDHGVLEHALRYTDQAVVRRCRDFIADLYNRGEPISDFFAREVASLPPPHPRKPTLPRAYLKRTGRPQPIRS
jgi:hypothetical protein